LQKISKALNKKISELVVVVLDRPRHEKLIKEIRQAGARVRLITDGDVAAAVATCFPESGIDVLMGTGGSTEAVLAAVPLKIFNGQLLARFKARSDKDLEDIKKHLKKAGINNVNKVFTAEDLAKGKQLTFTATGVIEGPLLSGVDFREDKIITHSMVVRGQSGTIRYITTHHKKLK
jgi:fructose-1,6-bisphosphatase II